MKKKTPCQPKLTRDPFNVPLRHSSTPGPASARRSQTSLRLYETSLCLYGTLRRMACTRPCPALPTQCLAKHCFADTMPRFACTGPRNALPSRRCTSPCHCRATRGHASPSRCGMSPCPSRAVWRLAPAALNQTGLHETLPARCRVLPCLANA